MALKHIEPATKPTEKIFDYEYITDLVERYEDEAADKAIALLHKYGDSNHLTILEKNILDDTTSVSIYIFPDTWQIYEAMDKMFDEYMEGALSNGSRYSCSFSAMLEVLGPYQVAAADANY